MFRARTTRPFINKPISQLNLVTVEQNFLEINNNKTELIKIMKDYLTKETTRVTTTDRLDTLRAKFA